MRLLFKKAKNGKLEQPYHKAFNLSRPGQQFDRTSQYRQETPSIALAVRYKFCSGYKLTDKKIYIWVAIILLFFAGSKVYPNDIDTSKVNKIKAGLLYNMAKMVTWPETSFENNDPITLLFIGDNSGGIGSYFASQVRSRSLTVKGRTLSVKQLFRTEFDDVVREEVKKCHILYILSNYKSPILELLQTIGNRSVLVVGESSNFPKKGGMIGLSIEKKRVGISVNLDAVKNQKLAISAQFLQHAKIMKTEK